MKHTGQDVLDFLNEALSRINNVISNAKMKVDGDFWRIEIFIGNDTAEEIEDKMEWFEYTFQDMHLKANLTDTHIHIAYFYKSDIEITL